MRLMRCCIHTSAGMLLTCKTACAQWRNPAELHGVGQYGADAYFMFCRGAWRALAPADKDLARYHAWLAATGGEGTGLARDAVVPTVPLENPIPNPEPRSPGGGATRDGRDARPANQFAAFSPARERARGDPGGAGAPAGERGCVLARCASRGAGDTGRVEWPGGPVGGSLVVQPGLQSPRLGSCGAAAAATAAEGGLPAGVGESVVQ